MVCGRLLAFDAAGGSGATGSWKSWMAKFKHLPYHNPYQSLDLQCCMPRELACCSDSPHNKLLKAVKK